MIEDILGDDWILVDRLTRQYIEGKYYDYPIKILNAFKNIGLKRAILMAISYMAALMKYRLLKKLRISKNISWRILAAGWANSACSIIHKRFGEQIARSCI